MNGINARTVNVVAVLLLNRDDTFGIGEKDGGSVGL
jgi:hypothetical protein